MIRTAPGVRLTLLPNEHVVAGEPLNLDERLIAFSFEDSEKKADKLSLQLNNFDLSLFDREELSGGAIFEVSWGYPGQMAPPRRAVIQKLKGFTKLTLEGRAISALMDHETKSRAWENKTRAQAAQEIAEERGYEGASLDVEETDEVFDVINQASETDARFLRRLAAQEGFEFYVDDDGLHFHRRLRRLRRLPHRRPLPHRGPGSPLHPGFSRSAGSERLPSPAPPSPQPQPQRLR